jgi:exosortase/archaeosortase family protein
MSSEALPGRPAPLDRAARGRHRSQPPARQARSARPHRPARSARSERPARSARAAASLARRVLCRLISVALICAAGLAADQQMRGRDMEAWLASHTLSLIGTQTGYYGGSLAMVWFEMSPIWRIGFEVTAECTISFLIIPFLLATGLLVWKQGLLLRPFIGLIVAAVMLLSMNQVRLLQIAIFVRKMGVSSGFYWGHTLVGSLITICGLAITLVVFARIAVSWRGKGPEL